RQESLPRNARRHGDHVLLGDPDLDEARRLLELDAADATVRREIRIQDDELRMLLDQLQELLTVRRRDVLIRNRRAAHPGARLRLAFERRAVVQRRDRFELDIGQPLLDAPDKFDVCALERIVVRRTGVPAIGAASFAESGWMLHERHAATLDRVRDENLRHIVRRGAHRRESDGKRVVVMAVGDFDVTAERAQLCLEVAEGEDLLGWAVRLQLVAVDDGPEIADALVRGRAECLPVLALLQLAVAGHDDHDAASPQMPLCPGDPAALRETHPERARVRLDSRHTDVGVTVEPAEPPEAQQAVRRDHAECVQRGVEAGGVVTLRGEEDVSIRVTPAQLRDVQLPPEQVDDYVEGAEARAEVSGTCALDRHERICAAHVGEQPQVAAGALELPRRYQPELGHDPGTVAESARLPKIATTATSANIGVSGIENSACGSCESACTNTTPRPATPSNARAGDPRGLRSAMPIPASTSQTIGAVGRSQLSGPSLAPSHRDPLRSGSCAFQSRTRSVSSA